MKEAARNVTQRRITKKPHTAYDVTDTEKLLEHKKVPNELTPSRLGMASNLV